MRECLRLARLPTLAFACALLLGAGCKTHAPRPIGSPASASEHRAIAAVTAPPASDELRLAVGLRVVVAGAHLHTARQGGHSVRLPAGGAIMLVHTLDGERVPVSTMSYDTRDVLGDDGGLPGLFDFSLTLHVAPADLRAVPLAIEQRLDEAEDLGPPPPRENAPDRDVDARTPARSMSSVEALKGIVGEHDSS